MAYTNFQHCTVEEYNQIIYSQGADNKIKILFNGVELEDADRYCEKLTLKSRILPDDSSKRLSLDNFVSKEAELILHRIDESVIQDQVEISIGTLVDDENEIYEYVPLGIFNIQDTPTTDKDKITVKLRDNRVKFDFNYNAKPLIDENDGIVTKLQILQDICEKAEVETDIEEFLGSEDTLSIYDNTITATTYISYLAEQAGCIASIDRLGKLIFVDLSNVSTNRVPLSIVEKYEKGIPFKIERVVYEDGIRKYETSNDESLNTLYLNSANPYISSQQQINNIYSLLNNFLIDSVETGKILGNPAIDSYDLIEVYDDYENNETIFKTLANHTLTYNGVLISQYKTQIGLEQRTENVTINGEPTFRKWAKTNIDNVNAEITIQAGQIQETQNNLENNYYNKSSVDTLIINSATGVTNTFSEAGGNNVFRNTGLWFGPDTTTEEKEASSTNGKIEIDDGADNTLSNLKIYGNTSQDGTPTPDTPVEIQNVTGLQNINVCGKNLFDKDNVRDGYRLTQDGYYADKGYSATEIIGVIPNTTYSTSWTMSWDECICIYDKNENFSRRIQNGTNFTTTTNEHYIRACVKNNNLSTAQIEKGSTASEYEAYKGQSYEINLGKNLLDIKDGSYSYSTTNTWKVQDHIVSLSVNYITYQGGALQLVKGASARWASGTDNHITQNGGTYTLSVIKNGTITYGTNGSASLYCYIYKDDGTVRKEQLVIRTNDSSFTKTITLANDEHFGEITLYSQFIQCENVEFKIMLEKGSQASSYSPYKTPIELCKIGDYQDRIYKNGNKWYLEKNIGKVVLDGSESGWAYDSVSKYFRCPSYSFTELPLEMTRANKASYIQYSNNFTLNKSWSGTGSFRDTTDVSMFYPAQNSGYKISLRNVNFTTTSDFSNWLSSNNTLIYYPLATPTTTEITDTELLSQLNSIKTIDGYNLILLASNDVDTEFDITYLIDFTYYEYWTGDLGKIKEEKAANLNALLLQHGTVYQEQQVPNGSYTISFKYKKLINLANVKCIINDVEYELTANDDTEFTQTIDVSTQHIRVTFTSDRQNSCEIYDLMVNAGKVKLAYSQNQNETTTDTVNISKGITITSTDTDTTFKANADGIRTLDRNGNVLTKFTDTGMTTKEMIVEDTSQIVGVLVQQVGDQTWFTRL